MAMLLAGFGGLFSVVLEADLTGLSLFITGLFIITSLKCGYDIYNLEKTGEVDSKKIEFGWFMSEVFLSIGMVGTIIGFIFIMKDFSSVNFEDVATIQDLIRNLGSGVSTALYTTLFGLTASIVTKVQYFIFESGLEDKEDEEK
jgi:flagellar motor component MotA